MVDLSDKLSRLIECSLCLEICKTPYRLPCEHFYCKEPCLKNLTKTVPSLCPLCRQAFTLAEAQPFRLLNDLLEMVQQPKHDNQNDKVTFTEFGRQTDSPPQAFGNFGKPVCEDRRQFANLNQQLPKFDKKPETCETARIPQSDCGNICYSLTCAGPSVCKLIHIDDLTFCSTTVAHPAGPSGNNRSPGQSCGKKSTNSSQFPQKETAEKNKPTIVTGNAAAEAAATVTIRSSEEQNASVLCTNLACEGSGVCKLMHADDLLYASENQGLPTKLNGNSTPMPPRLEKLKSEKASDDNSELCTNLSCSGMPMCPKIHLSDVLNPSYGYRSGHERPLPTQQPAPARPTSISKPEPAGRKVQEGKLPEVGQFCTDITCRGSRVCPKIHMNDLMA
ncbi:hypothetical protein AAHC03_026689 [Spirometra sp. Aus1]